MNDIDQATINLRYAQAQERKIRVLFKEVGQLKELIEALRLHLISLGENKNANT